MEDIPLMTTHVGVFHVSKSIEEIMQFLVRWVKKGNAPWKKLLETDTSMPLLADYFEAIEQPDGSVEIFFFNGAVSRVFRYFDEFSVFSVRLNIVTTGETQVSITFEPDCNREFIGWLENLYFALKQHEKFLEDYADLVQNEVPTETKVENSTGRARWLELATMSEEDWLTIEDGLDVPKSSVEGELAQLKPSSSDPRPKESIQVKVSLIHWAITTRRMTTTIATDLTCTSKNTYKKYRANGWLYTEEELVSILHKSVETAWEDLLASVL
jgi:hypothetical protein